MFAPLPLRRTALLVLLLPSALLMAQESDTLPADTVNLAPVTVTAARHAGDLFRVPLAITMIQRRDLFGTRGVGLDDALALVPGVLAQSRYGSSDVRLVIRGFGARGAGDRSNSGTSRGIRVLLDGFPETEPDGRTSFDGIDLAAAHAIEVIRSNASALWGNAAGGVVSVSTVPEFGRSLMGADAMTGSFGLRRWAATGGTAVGAGKLSASFVRTTFDGWRVHSGSERSLANLALLTPVGPATRLGVFAVTSFNFFRIPGPLTATQVAGDPRQAHPTYFERHERRENRVGRLGVSFDHAWTETRGVSASLFVNPKVLHRSERGTYRDFTRYHLGGNVVFRLGSFTLGSDQAYQDGAVLFYPLTPEGTRGDSVVNNQREGALNLGLFAQRELVLSDAWRLTLGARVDDITYFYQDYQNPELDDTKSFRGVTPKVGVTFRPERNHSVYLSVGGGIEAPAGNETDPASTFGQDSVYGLNPLLDPIRSTTFELGTRRVLLFQRGPLRGLSYDAALYQTEVRKEIVPYRGGRFYFTAGSAHRRGAELALALHGVAGLVLQTAVAYQHHRYGTYLVDSVHYDTARAGHFANYGGNEVVGVPSFTYTVNLTAAPSGVRPFMLKLALQGASSYFADDANTVQVPAYRVVSVTIGTDGVAWPGAGIALHGFVTVNNLFDRDYIASAFLNPDVVGGEAVAFEPGMPLNLVVGLSFSRRPPS